MKKGKLNLCPCCESETTSKKKDAICFLENNRIKDVDTLQNEIDKHFAHYECMCCFFRDVHILGRQDFQENLN